MKGGQCAKMSSTKLEFQLRSFFKKGYKNFGEFVIVAINILMFFLHFSKQVISKGREIGPAGVEITLRETSGQN